VLERLTRSLREASKFRVGIRKATEGHYRICTFAGPRFSGRFGSTRKAWALCDLDGTH